MGQHVYTAGTDTSSRASTNATSTHTSQEHAGMAILQLLELSSNQLSGKLPQEWAALRSLKSLSV